MPWTCPRCREPFAFPDESHECAGFPDFRIDGRVPNGAPGKDHAPALPDALSIPEAIRYALDLALMATGVRDGFESSIDPRALHPAIRSYRSSAKFAHLGKATSITGQDERMHAGRIAQRLLVQALGQRLELAGNWGSGKAVRTRVDAIYTLARRLAEEHGLNMESFRRHPV